MNLPKICSWFRIWLLCCDVFEDGFLDLKVNQFAQKLSVIKPPSELILDPRLFGLWKSEGGEYFREFNSNHAHRFYKAGGTSLDWMWSVADKDFDLLFMSCTNKDGDLVYDLFGYIVEHNALSLILMHTNISGRLIGGKATFTKQ